MKDIFFHNPDKDLLMELAHLTGAFDKAIALISDDFRILHQTPACSSVLSPNSFADIRDILSSSLIDSIASCFESEASYLIEENIDNLKYSISIRPYNKYILLLFTPMASNNSENSCESYYLTKIEGYLSVILAANSGIQNNINPKNIKKYHDAIKRNSLRIIRAIDHTNILKPSFNIDNLHIKPCDLSQLLEDIVEDTNTILENSNRSIKLNCPKNIYGNFDSGHIAIALYNIISNCLHFGEGVINIRVKLTDTNVIIAISDDGCGLDDKAIEKVNSSALRIGDFEDIKEDIGYGLALARKIAILHSGNLLFLTSDKNTTHPLITLPLSLKESSKINQNLSSFITSGFSSIDVELSSIL